MEYRSCRRCTRTDLGYDGMLINNQLWYCYSCSRMPCELGETKKTTSQLELATKKYEWKWWPRVRRATKGRITVKANNRTIAFQIGADTWKKAGGSPMSLLKLFSRHSKATDPVSDHLENHPDKETNPCGEITLDPRPKSWGKCPEALRPKIVDYSSIRPQGEPIKYVHNPIQMKGWDHYHDDKDRLCYLRFDGVTVNALLDCRHPTLGLIEKNWTSIKEAMAYIDERLPLVS